MCEPSLTDWFFFLVLNIGNATVEAIPVGTRLLVAAVQAVAVRLAGFQSVAIAALAPAVKCVLSYRACMICVLTHWPQGSVPRHDVRLGLSSDHEVRPFACAASVSATLMPVRRQRALDERVRRALARRVRGGGRGRGGHRGREGLPRDGLARRDLGPLPRAAREAAARIR